MGLFDVIGKIYNTVDSAAAKTNQDIAKKTEMYKNKSTSELKEIYLKNNILSSKLAAKVVLESRGEYPFN